MTVREPADGPTPPETSNGAPAPGVSARSLPDSLRALVAAHPVAVAAIVACSLTTLAVGHAAGKSLHAAGYVTACAAGILLVRRFVPRGPTPPVPRPRREAAVLAGFATAGLAAFVGLNAERFGGPALPGLVRLVLLAVVLLLMFPVAGTVWLWRNGSPPSAQGLRPRSVGASLLLVGVVAAAAVVFGRESLGRNLGEIRAMLSVGLVAGVLLQSFAEELLRFQHQTRFGAALGSRPAGWLAASLVWGLLHVPRYYRGDPVEAGLAVVTLVPLGLLWSYASDRTGSLWPSAVAHSLNVWGLQSL